MKFYVRHGEKELTFPTMQELQTMYRLKFIAPEDLVRRETSDRWVPAGDLPELRFAPKPPKAERHIPAALWLTVAAFAFALLVKLFGLPVKH